VKIDGTSRPVQTVDFLRFGESTIGDAPPAATREAAPAAAASQGAQTFLMVFDDLSFTPGAGKGMPVAGERLLKSLDVGALVGVIATSGQGANVSPTRDRSQVEAALKTLVGQRVDSSLPYFITTQEAIDIDRGFIRDVFERVVARECEPDDEVCPAIIKGRARTLVTDSRRRVAQQLSSISQIIAAMARAPAPRVVILMTGGLMLQSDLNARDPLEALRDLAAASGVQLYALVDEGIAADVTDTSEDRATARREEVRSMTDGMFSVASAAGGSAFHVVGSADRFFTRVVSETSAIYRLGVEVTGAAGEAPRRADVSVSRSGVTVRSTGRALAAVAPTPLSRDELMQQRLAQGGTVSAVPVRIATRLRKHDTPGVQVMVDARLPASVATPVHLLFGLMDEAGTMVFAGSKDLQAPPAGAEHRILFPIAAPAGSYRLRFVAGDANDLIGSAEIPVEAQLTRLGPYEASDVMTVYRVNGQDGFSAYDVVPAAATELVASLEIYEAASATPGDSTAVRFTITRPDDETAIVERLAAPVSQFDRWTASAVLPLRSLSPGAYVVRAAILEKGIAVGTRTRTIRMGQ